MIRPELVPLLVVALLLVAAQPGVETVTTVVDGDQVVPEAADALIVVDGVVRVPDGTRTVAMVYVVGGTASIDGTVAGDVVQLGGTVTVGEAGAVTGRYQQFGGDLDAATGADVTPEVVAEPLTRDRSPRGTFAAFVLQAAGLAAVAYVLGRRYPDLLDTVADAVRNHPGVSWTVGLLASVSLLALFVFMAFTIVLLPVSVLGLVGGLLVILYAYVAVGHLLGRLVPTDRPGLPTAVGAVGFLAASRLVGAIPVLGDTVAALVVIAALGAVLVTYFGLRPFEPPTLSPVE